MNTRPLVSQPKDYPDWEINARLRGDSPDELSLHEAEPVKDPGDSDDERDENGYPKQTEQAAEGNMTPLHGWFAGIRRVAKSGSCCGSVAFLLLVAGWDHGWIPGLDSQFAKASDLKEFKTQSATQGSDLSRIVILNLAQAIRDVEHEICLADSNTKRQQLDNLQYEYIARTGGRYPHTDCPKIIVTESLKGANP